MLGLLEAGAPATASVAPDSVRRGGVGRGSAVAAAYMCVCVQVRAPPVDETVCRRREITPDKRRELSQESMEHSVV